MIPEFLIPVVLILQLGSADYHVRELATKKLGSQTADARLWMFGDKMARKDPEIRLRLKEWLAHKPKVIGFRDRNRLVGKWLWKSSWEKAPYVVEFSRDERHHSPRNELRGTWKVFYESSGECLLTMTYESNGVAASDVWVIEDAKEGFRGRLQRDGRHYIVATPTK